MKSQLPHDRWEVTRRPVWHRHSELHLSPAQRSHQHGTTFFQLAGAAGVLKVITDVREFLKYGVPQGPVLGQLSPAPSLMSLWTSGPGFGSSEVLGNTPSGCITFHQDVQIYLRGGA